MKMYSFNTNAHGFRSSTKRKCSSLTCCLIFVLLMSQTSCRPSETDNDKRSHDVFTYTDDADYLDADDIDWNNFAAVEATSKVHPIIFYKEDIVSEDYDPNKEKKNMTKEHHVNEIKPHHRRKYKEIARHHKRPNQNEPEKVYFDIDPIEQNFNEEHSNEDDNKFNVDDIHVEVISLLNEDNPNSNKKVSEEKTHSKYLLNKLPKKVNHRYRRDVTNEDESVSSAVSMRHKRNPFYQRNSHYANQLPQYRGVVFHPQLVIYPAKSSSASKHAIKSPNYYNAYSPGGGNVVNRRPTTTTSPPIGVPESIDDRFDTDRPVWPLVPSNDRTPATRPPTMRTPPPRRPPPPILQYGDEDYANGEDPAQNRNSRPGASASASASASSSSSGDRSFNTAPRTTPRPIMTTTLSTPAPTRGVSACIWAISSCCTRSEQIRYQCFERLGCSGAFWDLNPCADDIFRLAVQAADQYLE